MSILEVCVCLCNMRALQRKSAMREDADRRAGVWTKQMNKKVRLHKVSSSVRWPVVALANGTIGALVKLSLFKA